MAGTAHTSVKQKGKGHGARNHSHASGSRLACLFYAMFHVRWRPEREETKESRSRKGVRHCQADQE